MEKYRGISASDGIGIGQIFIMPDESHTGIPKFSISSDRLDEGWKRFEAALEKTKKDITELTDKDNPAQKAIFETYSMMLSDSEFIAGIKMSYQSTLFNIEYVLHSQIEDIAGKLRLSGDAYLSERAADITDIYGRVLSHLLGRSTFSTDHIPHGSVVIAQSINPSHAVALGRRAVAGIVMEEGGINSHVGILARNYGVPAVFGVKDIVHGIKQGACAIVDGTEGAVILDPDEACLADYSRKQRDETDRKTKLTQFRGRPSVCADGTEFTLYANIGLPGDVHEALAEGAQGIGLFRSEFLFMDSDGDVSEDAQFEAYKKVLSEMSGRPVVIRTLDAGGDKVISIQDTSGSEPNPLLGWRAIRFCLDRKDIFKTQLRALYRASVYGNLKIMFPLITDAEQLDAANAVAAEVRKELSEQHIPFNPGVPVGTMIETPAAAASADILARKCAFFSIGTNDLTQYTIAVDRENSRVASLFNEFHPAVLRMMKYTIDCAGSAGIPVSVCGELAGRPEGVFILAGFGVRQFSMSAKNISGVKEMLSRRTLAEISSAAEQALRLSSANEIRTFISTAAERGTAENSDGT